MAIIKVLKEDKETRLEEYKNSIVDRFANPAYVAYLQGEEEQIEIDGDEFDPAKDFIQRSFVNASTDADFISQFVDPKLEKERITGATGAYKSVITKAQRLGGLTDEEIKDKKAIEVLEVLIEKHKKAIEEAGKEVTDDRLKKNQEDLKAMQAELTAKVDELEKVKGTHVPKSDLEKIQLDHLKYVRETELSRYLEPFYKKLSETGRKSAQYMLMRIIDDRFDVDLEKDVTGKIVPRTYAKGKKEAGAYPKIDGRPNDSLMAHADVIGNEYGWFKASNSNDDVQEDPSKGVSKPIATSQTNLDAVLKNINASQIV